jgi:toxin ParE1/3/4
MPSYVIANRAREDLDTIWRYTAENWGLDQALRLNQQFQRRFQSLAEQPMSGRPRPDLAPRIRSVPVQSFLIIYRPIDDGVEIVRIAHGSRRLEDLLRQ